RTLFFRRHPTARTPPRCPTRRGVCPPTRCSRSRRKNEHMSVITYRQALRDTLRAEMLRDENVLVMGEEIGVFEGSYKITEGLLKEFGPKRVRDTPIAEEGFVGAAVGAAMLGLRPVVEIMTINFSLLAIDQIINHAAKIYGMFGGQTSVPMVIRTPGGGGQQLGATHSQNIELFYSFIPGLKVMAPSTPAEASSMLRAAVRDDVPLPFLENLGLYTSKGEAPDDYAEPENNDVATLGRAGSPARAPTSPSSVTPVWPRWPPRSPRSSLRRTSASRSSICAASAPSTARPSWTRSRRPVPP